MSASGVVIGIGFGFLIGLGSWALLSGARVVIWRVALLVGQIKSIMSLIWDTIDDIRCARQGGWALVIWDYAIHRNILSFHLIYLLCARLEAYLVLCIVSRLRNGMGNVLGDGRSSLNQTLGIGAANRMYARLLRYAEGKSLTI